MFQFNTTKFLWLTLLISIMVLSPYYAFSQKRDIVFTHYNTSNGLSQNTVHDIAQDPKGFLWIGTEDGLNMFDGYSFTHFKKNLKNPFSISDNFSNSLYVDRKGRLWIGSNDKGVNLYDPKTEKFKSIQTYQLNNKEYPIRFVSAIKEDKSGNIWFSCQGGLFQFNPDSFKIVAHYYPTNSPNSISDNLIRTLFIENNTIWIGTESGGLNKFDIETLQFSIYKHSSSNSSISNNGISSIIRDRKGRLWVGTNNGLNLFDEKANKFHHYFNDPTNKFSLSDNIISCLLEDTDENLWIGTPSGLIRFDRDNELFFIWKRDPLNPLTSLSENAIFSIFQDKYGQVWLGTLTAGLIKFNPSHKAFTHFHHDEQNKNSLSNNVIREIYEDDQGLIWISTFDTGLDVYNPSTKQFQFYSHNPKDSRSLSSNKVTSVFKDSKSNIWIATHGGGLNRAYLENGKYKFQRYLNNPNDSLSISNNAILEVTEDRWGRIWLGTRIGIDLFNPLNDTFVHFKNNPNNRNSLVPNTVQSGCIQFDNYNNMWVGTWSGLSKIELSNDDHLPQNFTSFTQNDSAKFSLNDSRVISILLSNNNILWVGTCGGGLNKVSLNDNGEVISIEYYTENDGLSNNVIYSILEDDKGDIWLSTNLGISKFNPKTKFFDNYDVNDGLQGNQFYWGAACKLKSGEFAFGGVNGFNTFYPNKIKPDLVVPDVVITDFKISNVVVPIDSASQLPNDIVYTNNIKLKYHENAISFEFSALHFLDPLKNRYAYKLEGFDEDWIYTSSQKRFAVYTNLEPREYTFKVKGSNSDGIWNEISTDVKIIITPPYWKNWWFRVAVIILFVLILGALYWVRTSTLRKHQRFLEVVVDQKTKEVLLQKEELQAANEELMVSNEELHEQREELETTLMTLTQAQNNMIQLEKMASIGILAAGVAHEINNPLNFINAGIIGLESYFDEKLPEHKSEVDVLLNGIHTGVERAAVIVASLGHYSRKDDLKFLECDLNSIIENCLVILHSKTKGHIDIIKEFSSQPCKLIGNEGKLHQAILNVLANAIQAIDNIGSIVIKTKIDGDIITLSITDTGSGIRAENLSKILDPFFTTKEPGKGTGLGLSITYNIIKEHSGSIEFKSKVGEGTEVVIQLPAIR